MSTNFTAALTMRYWMGKLQIDQQYVVSDRHCDNAGYMAKNYQPPNIEINCQSAQAPHENITKFAFPKDDTKIMLLAHKYDLPGISQHRVCTQLHIPSEVAGLQKYQSSVAAGFTTGLQQLRSIVQQFNRIISIVATIEIIRPAWINQQ